MGGVQGMGSCGRQVTQNLEDLWRRGPTLRAHRLRCETFAVVVASLAAASGSPSICQEVVPPRHSRRHRDKKKRYPKRDPHHPESLGQGTFKPPLRRPVVRARVPRRVTRLHDIHRDNAPRVHPHHQPIRDPPRHDPPHAGDPECSEQQAQGCTTPFDHTSRAHAMLLRDRPTPITQSA